MYALQERGRDLSARTHTCTHICTYFKNNGEQEQLSNIYANLMSWVNWLDNSTDLRYQVKQFESVSICSMILKVMFHLQQEKWDSAYKISLLKNLLLAKFSTSCKIFFSLSLLQKFLLLCEVFSLLCLWWVVGGGGWGRQFWMCLLWRMSTLEEVYAQGTIWIFLDFFLPKINYSK